MANIATFTVVLNTPASVPILVDYTTVDESAIGYIDYAICSGTLTFPPGVTSQTVNVRLMSSTTSLASKKFGFALSNVREATLGTPSSAQCVISAPPSYAAVPFPGRRMALIGDSITYANNHWNAPVSNIYGGGSSPKTRNEYYSTGMTGLLTYTNAILGNVVELEPALQPNTQPGANATSPKNGYNFAVYSSQLTQWMSADFDPAPVSGITSHNIGPMLNAENYSSKWDMVFVLGGTNDLAQNATSASILANIMSYAITLAQLGKWVFLSTLTPRTADMLQYSASGAGYNQAEIAIIMQSLLSVNKGLRDWLTPTAYVTPPNNIFLVDAWANLVGPTASILSVPTDPAGLLSPSSGIVSGALLPSTPGNYRSDAPGLRFMYDGLHMAPPAAYVLGKALAASMVSAGVPAAVSGQLGGSTAAGVSPCTIGTNLMLNTNMTKSTSAARAAGSKLVLGRAIGLGAPVTVSGFTAPTMDAYTNQGAGYAHGQVPDYWFVYRASNSDNESYSNFNAYTYSSLEGPTSAPMSYQADATWADGCLTTAITSETFTINGVTTTNAPGFALTFSRGAGIIGGDTAVNNVAFIVKYIVAEGQHGPWDNWGYESGPQTPWPSPPYSPGQYLALDCVMKFSGLSPNLCACRIVANFLCIDFSNANSNPAVISSIALAESFFPFSNISNCHQHTENRYLAIRSPAVQVPTPVSGETGVYCQLVWQFSYDCATVPATGTITIINPRLASVTPPSGGL